MFELRDYQKFASKAAYEHDNGIIVLPTGAGKSLVIADIVSKADSRVLIFQPNKEILEQNFKKMEFFGFEDATIYSSSMKTKELGKATFATIGSVMNNIEEFKDFKTIIIDECHLVNAKGGQYLEFIKFVKPDRLIGLTATPYRLHSNSFGSTIKMLTRTRPKVFKDIIHVTQTSELLEHGYLLNPGFITNKNAAEKRSILKPNSTGANYTEASVTRFLEAIDNVNEAHKSIYDALYHKRKHILVFTESVADSDKLINMIQQDNSMNLDLDRHITIGTVSASTKAKDRELLLNDFKSGKIKVMVNVGVLTTGFDFPELDCLVIGRPTMSLALWYQMVGRVVRPHPSKTDTIVYDLCGNLDYFGNPLMLQLKQGGTGLWDAYLDGIQVTTKLLESIEKLDDDIMPFGKYKGYTLGKIPDGYLSWAIGNINQERLLVKMKEELNSRQS